MDTSFETITLGGGCFWCIEAVFTQVQGVERVTSGYMGGHVDNPDYQRVCEGNTGHAEVVQVAFNPQVLSLHDLLMIFFTVHDPTTLNRQGNDVGTQYRSVVFYHQPEQKTVVEKVIAELAAEGLYRDPIVTEVQAAETFYAAEDYHHDYFARNPRQAYCQFVVAPKVAKFRQNFQHLMR